MTDERALLTAILQQPDDDGRKLAYADWLEERGDPRGEYLRLMMQVRQERVITPEQRQRHKDLSEELARLRDEAHREFMLSLDEGRPHPDDRHRRDRMAELEILLTDLSQQTRRQIPVRLQELAATLDPRWLAVVSDPDIEGCGRSGSSLRFDFLCDKSWADMTPTKDKNVRHCETCRKNVHFCDNIADAREHSQADHCIAIDLGVIRREDDLITSVMAMGFVQPSRESIRQRNERDMDPVSRARLDARKKAQKKQKQKR